MSSRSEAYSAFKSKQGTIVAAAGGMILAFVSTLLHIGEEAQVPPASLPASYERERAQGWDVERRVDLDWLLKCVVRVHVGCL
jgi:hypothetical protein